MLLAERSGKDKGARGWSVRLSNCLDPVGMISGQTSVSLIGHRAQSMLVV